MSTVEYRGALDGQGVTMFDGVPWIIVLRLPIKIESEGNRRDHFRAVAARKKAQRDPTYDAVEERWRSTPLETPLYVTLTRIGPRKLDDDNLASGFKFVRDGVAKAVGIDDGDRSRIRWRYRQKTGKELALGGKRPKYAVEIRIEHAERTAT